MGDTTDEDGSFEPPQAAGHSRADHARAAYAAGQRNAAARRDERRGGAAKAPRAERHLKKVAQHAIDVSPKSVLGALEFECGCGSPHCVEPTSELIRSCAAHNLNTRNFGRSLIRMLRTAVLDTEDGLVLDMHAARVQLTCIGEGIVACPVRFKSLFAIKPSMWTGFAASVLKPVLPASLWGRAPRAPRPPLCAEMVAAWVRRWATQVGCYLPNATKEVVVKIDAKTKRTIWMLYLNEVSGFAVSYQYFCEVYTTEAARPPIIRQKEKKDVSSVCDDCLRLGDQLHFALKRNDSALIAATKEALAAHIELVREERSFYFANIAGASQSPPDCMSWVWDIMDQKKTLMPNWKDTLALHMANTPRMPMKLLGLKPHGADGWYGFTAPPWVPKGANLICTAALLALREAKARHGSLPLVMKVCVDGGSENWNHTVFAFFTHLVTTGVVKEVWLARMPVGHTHNDQDALFSRVSVGLHGAGSMDNGRGSLTPEEWADTLRACFVGERSKPVIVPLSSVFNFDSYYSEHMAVLSGYGASIQHTREEGGTVRLESTRRSHLRVALIRMDAGSAVATIRFAQTATAAARGEWYPATPPPPSTPFARPTWCSLSAHTGAAVLTALPADEPARMRYFPTDWDGYTDFLATLREASVLEAWPPSATRAWHVYLANPPCALGGVAWDLAALRSPPRLAASPAVCACAGLRQLAVCPLITAKRTKAHKAAEEAAAGCVVGERGSFDVPFSRLDVGDFAFALAWESAEHAFTMRVPGSGRLAPQVELLEIEALEASGRGKARATHALPLARGGVLTQALAAAGDLALLGAEEPRWRAEV